MGPHQEPPPSPKLAWHGELSGLVSNSYPKAWKAGWLALGRMAEHSITLPVESLPEQASPSCGLELGHVGDS